MLEQRDEVVVIGGESLGVCQRGDERCAVIMQEGLEDAGEGGEDKQAGEHADAVDGKAAEPFDEVVTGGSEDEEFVTEVGDCDVQRRGQDGSEDDCEIEEVRGKDPVEKSESYREGEVAEDRVEDADAEVAGELSAWN